MLDSVTEALQPRERGILDYGFCESRHRLRSEVRTFVMLITPRWHYTPASFMLYLLQMSKPLTETNPYRVNLQLREKLLYTSVCSSTAIEGVKVTPELEAITVYPGQIPLVKRPDGSYEPRR